MQKLKPLAPRGFQDRTGSLFLREEAMLKSIQSVYQSYGFLPLETPMIEYAESLGKFLPDSDRPNEGVFAFQDDDGQWLSLRYDLTAPLARFVAANFQDLPKPYRSFRAGAVFRNEKPGPGRFRQFIQCDADTVGTASPLSDAEMMLMASEVLQAVGLSQNDYEVKFSHRGLLETLLASLAITEETQKLTVLRAIDKLDRLGLEGVKALLGEGRKDPSGDFTKGAGLPPSSIEMVLQFLCAKKSSNQDTLKALKSLFGMGNTALENCEAILEILKSTEAPIQFDPSIVRGLAYYTGAIFEANVTFETVNEKGEKALFGAVGGGGRYDGLISRFRSEPVPATGFSIGVSRLAAALAAKTTEISPAPVLILLMDKGTEGELLQLASSLRKEGVQTEVYVGESGLKAQMKYADRRGAPLVILQGSEERARGEYLIKNLKEGARQSNNIESHEEWRTARPAQFAVKAEDLIETVKRTLLEEIL